MIVSKSGLTHKFVIFSKPANIFGLICLNLLSLSKTSLNWFAPSNALSSISLIILFLRSNLCRYDNLLNRPVFFTFKIWLSFSRLQDNNQRVNECQSVCPSILTVRSQTSAHLWECLAIDCENSRQPFRHRHTFAGIWCQPNTGRRIWCATLPLADI